MARVLNRLTDVKIRKLKPKARPYKETDGGGLYLEVMPGGGMLWRMKYRYNDKENRLAFGKYPDVSLGDARKRREAARNQIADGVDPAAEKRAEKAEARVKADNTFLAVANSWLASKKKVLSDSSIRNYENWLERDILPHIGNRPVADLRAQDYLAVFRIAEKKGGATANHVKGVCGQVQRYAVASGVAEYDVVRPLSVVMPPPETRHHPAQTEPGKVAELMRKIDSYKGHGVVTSALKIAPYVFVRPGELRAMQWSDIDLEAAEWRYIVTKTRSPHIVPLARQVIAMLKEMQPLTGHGQYVFPSAAGDKPFSTAALTQALRRVGVGAEDQSLHGFRATARTILDEVLGERVDLIEHQLAHAVRDPNGRAYNRTAHLPERKKMMQRWADYLDDLKAGAKVIKLRA